jgi:probable phosphoglycerate mutase
VIWLVRHGETEMNRQGRFQGRLDAPLTELGEAHALKVGAHLRALMQTEGGAWSLDASPLGRTRRTAALIAEQTGLEVRRFDDRLAEVDFGDWEGLDRDGIVALRPDLAGFTKFFLRNPNGETHAQLSQRVRSWMDEALATPDQRIAVSHAGVGRMMRGLVLGLAVEELRELDTPHDVIFRIGEGRVDRFECAPLPSAGVGR